MTEPGLEQWYLRTYELEQKPWQMPAHTWRIIGNRYINLVLFLSTIFSTWYVGSIIFSDYPYGGMAYAVPIVLILLAHEMGHFLMCRKYGVPATLPYFIPFPFPSFNPFGTMGALISMRGAIPSRKALFDIGAGGPLAGVAVVLPSLFIGLGLSEIIPQTHPSTGGLVLGESLLFKAIAWIMLGAQPEGTQVIYHPVAYAGWAGLFITGLNLIPVGQLDGGHVTYAMFGQRARYFTWGLIVAIGILAVFNYSWALFFLLLAIFGRRHPSPLDDYTPLDRSRRRLGVLIVLLFIASFMPFPFRF